MMTEDIEPQYAPLLDTEVACALLDVYELDGHDWRTTMRTRSSSCW